MGGVGLLFDEVPYFKAIGVFDFQAMNPAHSVELFLDRRRGWLRKPVVISSVWFKLVGDENSKNTVDFGMACFGIKVPPNVKTVNH